MLNTTFPTMIPSVVDASKMMRSTLIPYATSTRLPSILTDSQKLREIISTPTQTSPSSTQNIPSVFAASKMVRSTLLPHATSMRLPSILTASQKLREIIPSILTDSQKLREIIASILTDSQKLSEIIISTPTQTPPSSTSNTPSTATQPHWHVPVSAALGGALGGFICFPFEGLKKKLQSGQLINAHAFHPTELYRGSSSFSLSVTIATIASMTFRHILQSLPGYDPSSSFWQANTAIFGGMLGAIIGSTPVENIILTQQLHKTNPAEAIRLLLKQKITRPWVGLIELAMREAGFAGVMMWAGRASNEWAFKQTNNHTIAAIAEVLVAVLGAIITHPFDTLATYKQKHDGTVSSREAFKALIDQNGYRALFRGVHQRIFLFTGCAVIIPRMEQLARECLSHLSTKK